MIKSIVIDNGEKIEAGHYYERDKVLQLIEARYGYKHTFKDYLFLPFYSIMGWYGEYINLDIKNNEVGENSLAYVKENLTPRIVKDIEWARVFDKVINGSQYIIEVEVGDDIVLPQVILIVYDALGFKHHEEPCSSIEQAKVFLTNLI